MMMKKSVRSAWVRAFVRIFICSENHPGPSARFTAKQDFCRRRDDNQIDFISGQNAVITAS